MSARTRLAAAGLCDIADKLDAGVRLELEDGVRLFEAPDLAGGRLARQPRAREAPRRAHVLQLQPAPRADQRLRGELPVLLVRAAEGRRAGAYTMTLEQAWQKLRERAHQPLTEIHIVNGLHPGLPFGTTWSS